MVADRTWSSTTSLGLPALPQGPLDACSCVQSEVLLQGQAMQLTHWCCVHDGEALRAERTHTHLVLTLLTRGACEVVDGRWRQTLDPSVALLHRPGAAYRTRHPHGLGDAGFSLAFHPDTVRSLPTEAPRPSTVHAVPRSALVANTWIALHRVRVGRQVDPLEVEELALGLLAAVLGAALGSDPSCHARLADRARAVLAARFRERLSLSDVARDLCCSPSHLCRVFRDQTGTTLSRWLLRRRLLAALDELRTSRPLADVAQRCGFASHAHLSDRVREAFGVPPSVLRARLFAP